MSNDTFHSEGTLLVVAGSLPGRLAPVYGPRPAQLTTAQFHTCKRAQSLMPPILRALHSDLAQVQLFVWNTCQRFECYCWWPTFRSTPEIDSASAVVRQHLFPDCPAASLFVMTGRDAKCHLLRTAAGLNSTLPGEFDVLEQLEAAARLATRTGVAGEAVCSLINSVTEAVDALRRQSGWQEYSSSHAYAAVEPLFSASPVDLRAGPVTILGGSTTSAALIRTLIEDLAVPSDVITLLFRGNRRGGQVKRLRKALRGGQALRVGSYSEPQVVSRIASSALVCFGIDHAEPVLTATALAEYQASSAALPVVLDFNTFASTSGLEQMPGVMLHAAAALNDQVDRFADALCARPEFHSARMAMEIAIDQFVAAGVPLTVAGSCAVAPDNLVYHASEASQSQRS